MRTKIYLLFILSVFFLPKAFSQSQFMPAKKDTVPFNYAYWNALADKEHLSAAERAEMIAGQKKIFLQEQAHEHDQPQNLIWVNAPAAPSNQKGYGQNTTFAGPCTNIDFESGTMAGWTRSTGWNPLTNPLGCCPNPNGDQTIMAGGIDPFGGFPCVFPGGGSFSLRLGSTATGGFADRISQTFFVTAANANFTYRYAAVLNDGGHNLADQPRFTSEIIDSLGNPVPCTFYQVSAGSGVTGYFTSSLTANGGAVICKNWTNVLVDLSPNIGQNVTLRFSVYDCKQTGHFAYAYIDGLCTNFATAVKDTICPNVPTTICAPTGFSTTTWNGPGGVVSNTNQCISVSAPGVYTCATILVPGCPGPTFTHTLILRPSPVISFTPVSLSPCSNQYTFNGTIGIPSGSVVSYQWSFNDGTFNTTTLNPVHSFAGPGTYQIKLRATTNKGCVDSLIVPITIFPPPILAFSPPSNCINTSVQFTNTSSVAVGTITAFSWTLGNGPTSTLTNPTNTYAASGIYTITLRGTTNQGCSATLTQTLGIFPPPVVSFSASPLCDINGTSFSPATSTAIASGSLTQFFWNFGDGGTSNAANPIHIYNVPGTYSVSFTAISNHNCSATASNVFSISPSPTVAFATTSVNACSHNFTFTNISASGFGPISYTWNFGGGNTTTATSPSYTFPLDGSYTISLIGKLSNGCADTSYHYVSIYPEPVININVPASCENAIISVSTTALSGSVTSYLWDFGDPGSGALNTSTLQSPTHFYSSTAVYTLNLNIVSNLNCPSSSSQIVTVYPNPVASFSFSTLNNCSLPFSFLNSSTTATIGASTLASYKWNFGGIATSSLASPGTFTFPANGSYSVSLIAITNHNCSDTTGTTILIHPKPVFDFSVNPICFGLPITFAGTSSISPIPLPGSSISSYTWNFGDNSFNGLAAPPPHTYSASGNYSVSFSGTSDMGCVGTKTNVQIIYPVPVVDFTTTSNMCLGNVTSFNGTNTIAAPGIIYGYNWTFGDGGLGYNANGTHTYVTAGTYPVTFSATSNNECVGSVSKTITINPLPAVSFTVNGGCLNVLSQFTESTTILFGSINSYSWNFGDGNNSITQNPSYTYTNFGVYTPTLTTVSNMGCSSKAVTTITINPIPIIAFSPPGSCQGSAIQFTNTSSIGLGSINSYTWDFADGTPTSNLFAPIHTYGTASGVFNVSLTAISNKGCVRTSTYNLTIYALPQATVTPIFNSCINDTALINTNMSIASGSITTYTLSYGDGSFTTFLNPTTFSSTNTHTYSAYNTYTLSLKVNSNNNCPITVTDSIKIYPKPFVNFTPNSVCYGHPVTFNNLSNIPSPGTYSISAHSWQFNDGSASPTSTLASPVHLFPGTNTYTTFNVVLTEFSYPEAQNLTSTLTCKASAAKTITVFPLPVPSFTANNACFGKVTNLINTTPTVNISGWSWYPNNNNQLVSVSQNLSYTFAASGTQKIKLIALNSFGCKDSIMDSVNVKVYANPVSSFTANSVCYKEPTLFSNTSTNGDGSVPQYTWSVGGLSFSNFKDPFYTFPQPGTYNIQLVTQTSDNGCIGITSSTVVVFPLPYISVSVNNACLGKASVFGNSSLGASTYSWTFGEPVSGANNSSSLSSPSHTYGSSGIFNPTLVAISSNNCISDSVLNVRVHDAPIANFTAKTICTGDKVDILNLSSSLDGTITSYSWDFNSDNLIESVAFTPVYTYSASGNYLINLEVTTQYGCKSVVSNSVYANPKAIPLIASNNKSGCPSLCVNFSLTTISSVPYTSSWDFGDGSPVSSTTLSTNSHCYEAGKYDFNLTLTTDAGCKSKLSYPSYVTVYPIPVPGFVVEPESIDEDDPSISVKSTASSDVSGTRYYISDGGSYGSPNFSHVIKNLDKKTKPMIVQIVKNANGCVDTLFKVLDIKPAYVIYIPNVFTPNGDGTNDNFEAKGVGIIKFSMQIYDRWGHEVFQTKDIYNSWDGNIKGSDEIGKQDVYTWKAQVTDIFNKNHYLVGHVSLIK